MGQLVEAVGNCKQMLQEFYAGLEDRKYLPLPEAQKKSLQVGAQKILSILFEGNTKASGL